MSLHHRRGTAKGRGKKSRNAAHKSSLNTTDAGLGLPRRLRSARLTRSRPGSKPSAGYDADTAATSFTRLAGKGREKNVIVAHFIHIILFTCKF